MRLPPLFLRLVILVFLVGGFQVGCAPKKPAPKPRVVAKPITPLPDPTPESTVARLTDENSSETKPHRIDTKTSFPQAISTLSEQPLATPSVVSDTLRPAPEASAKGSGATPAGAVAQSTTPASAAGSPAVREAREVREAAPAVVEKEMRVTIVGRTSTTPMPARGLTADGTESKFVMRDWTGVVLVPLQLVSSSAHSVNVQLERVEAHPLKDGSVRIWVRLRNLMDRPMHAEMGCAFRTHESPEGVRPAFYPFNMEAAAFCDLFFVSPRENLNTYTILVRNEGMLDTIKFRVK